MGEEKQVKLHGMWASPYVLRAKLALKIKGIEYEYIEEDLVNKSELLLKYNPVYKKVPILVHNGHPIVESSIIVEYIDEVWDHPPHLLPKDPYQKAKHRFWVAYFQQVCDTLGETLVREGKASQEMLDEYWEKLDVAEEYLKKEVFTNGSPSFIDSKPGYLDVVFYSYFGTLDVVEKIFGIKFLNIERYPLLCAWVNTLSEVVEVREVQPPKSKLLQNLQKIIPKA